MEEIHCVGFTGAIPVTCHLGPCSVNLLISRAPAAQPRHTEPHARWLRPSAAFSADRGPAGSLCARAAPPCCARRVLTAALPVPEDVAVPVIARLGKRRRVETARWMDGGFDATVLLAGNAALFSRVLALRPCPRAPSLTSQLVLKTVVAPRS